MKKQAVNKLSGKNQKIVAKLLTISTKYPLSMQLTRLTGDSYNPRNFEYFHDREVIKHKASGTYFIVYSFAEKENLHELDMYSHQCEYFKQTYKFTKIDIIVASTLFPDALAGVKKPVKPSKYK